MIDLVYKNITLHQGADFVESFTVTDENNVPFDLTDYEFRSEGRKYTSSTFYFTFGVNYVDAPNGEFELVMDALFTREVPAGRYNYDVFIRNMNNDDIYKVAYGQIEVVPAMTSEFEDLFPPL